MKSNFTNSVSTSSRSMGWDTLYLLVLLTLACGWVQAQSFTDVSSLIPGLPQVDNGSVAWADYDGDGRPDFLITGTSEGAPVSKLYRNTTSGFVDVTAATQVPGLPQVDHGSVAWADYDGDSRLDFLITGKSTAGSISKLYHNTVSGFVDVTATQVPDLPGVTDSSVAWGDYDGDGKPDFIITGDGPGVNLFDPVSKLYHNTGSKFEDVTTTQVSGGLLGVAFSSVTWADYDNDGRRDFLITGQNQDGPNGRVSKLYRNTVSGFVDVTASQVPGLPQVAGSSVAWADYDGDGKPDFLITGENPDGRISKLYHNTTSGFVDVTATQVPDLPGVTFGSVAWGDYDGDGRPDFLITGANASNLYHNTVSGFVDVTDSQLPDVPGVFFSSVTWIDYDGDGRPDFLITGDTTDDPISQLFRNICQPLTITAQPASGSVVCEGGSVSTSVGVTGSNPTYQWYKDGVLVSGQTSATLTLTNLQPANAGDYKAVITGCTSVTSNIFSLTISEPLTISAQPASGSVVCVGGSVSASVGVSGLNPTFQWYKDGTPVSGQNAATLTLSNLQPIDAGDYNVAITSTCNSLTSDAFSLTINQPLTISAQPASNSLVCAGGSVSTSVGVSGSNPAYQWYKDGTPVSGQTSANLALINLQPIDGGSYVVVITSTCNSLTSNAFSLIISEPLTISVQPASSSLVCAGSSVSTSVGVSGSTPTFQWYKDGTPVSGQNAATLTLSNLQPVDAGDYNVVITNTCSSLTSTAFSLTVSPLLTISAQPASGSVVCAGNSVSTSVSVSGSGVAYQWYKDGVLVTEQTSATLTLTKLKPTDAGAYVVVITGSCNSLTSSAFNLTVNQGADLTSRVHANPTTLYGNTNMTVVVDVFEINGVATTGLTIVRIPKDSKLSFDFPANATIVNNRPVANSAWSFDASSNLNYYVLTANQAIEGMGILSFGLNGVFRPQGTSGKFDLQAAVQAIGVCETVNNDSDGEKIDYFEQ